MNYIYRIKVSNTTDKPQHETPRDCKHILRICWTPFCTLSLRTHMPHTAGCFLPLGTHRVVYKHPVWCEGSSHIYTLPTCCTAPHDPLINILVRDQYALAVGQGGAAFGRWGCSVSGAASGNIKACLAATGLHLGRDLCPFFKYFLSNSLLRFCKPSYWLSL